MGSSIVEAVNHYSVQERTLVEVGRYQAGHDTESTMTVCVCQKWGPQCMWTPNICISLH